ncbi:MAG TPA: hypothetical protein PLY47_12285, partial [Rhodoglobus sp.]|nr:hypothetical protein [Rhodoglobus sp.]
MAATNMPAVALGVDLERTMIEACHLFDPSNDRRLITAPTCMTGTGSHKLAEFSEAHSMCGCQAAHVALERLRG